MKKGIGGFAEWGKENLIACHAELAEASLPLRRNGVDYQCGRDASTSSA
jgi:hypothetical protein